jgi:hypothetical protein
MQPRGPEPPGPTCTLRVYTHVLHGPHGTSLATARTASTGNGLHTASIGNGPHTASKGNGPHTASLGNGPHGTFRQRPAHGECEATARTARARQRLARQVRQRPAEVSAADQERDVLRNWADVGWWDRPVAANGPRCVVYVAEPKPCNRL